MFFCFLKKKRRKKRINLYGLPQSNTDLIDHRLSIDVDVLMHGDVLECVYVCA